MARFRRAKRLVLDLGTSAIRLCELAQTKTGYQLVRYYQREYLVDPSADEESRRTVQREALLSLLKEAKVHARKTIFGVPGQSVFIRTRPLPPVPEHKVTQIVRYEIQQQIPFSLDQIALDYQVLGRTEVGGYDVLMAAIKVDVVEKRLEAIRAAKRQVDVVDVCPFAAYNWLKYTGEFGDQGECVALIDLGATTTDIVIERESQFRFTRSLNLGGNDVTRKLADKFNLSFAEAEKAKRERAFAPTGDPARDGDVGQAVGEVLSRLCNEVMRSFAYFRSQPGGGAVSRVILVGGGACLRNMVPYLQRQLGVEVRIAQPLAGLALAPGAQEVNENPERAAVALGLALRASQDVAIAINLIPPAVTQSARRREQAIYWALVVILLVFIVASVIPAREAKNNAVLQHIKQLETAIRKYDPEALARRPGGGIGGTGGPSELLTRLSRARERLDKERQELQALEEKRTGRTFWIDYLKVINDARPRGNKLWISSFESAFMGIAGASTAGTQGVSMTMGFSGLGPSAGMGNTSGDAPSSSMSLSSLASNAEARATAGDAQLQIGPDPPKPNGIIITGYASGPESITEFKRTLEASGAFEAVIFNDASANRVPYTELYNTPVSQGGGGGATGASGGGGFSPMGGFSAGTGAGAGYGAPTPQAGGQTVTTFRMELKCRPEGLAQG